jgi:hypothetical protein
LLVFGGLDAWHDPPFEDLSFVVRRRHDADALVDGSCLW